MPLPTNITEEHVREAIRQFSAGRQHNFGQSTRFDLVHEGRRYPPKAILGIAGELAGGLPLTPEDLSGGRDHANKILSRLGFVVEPKHSAPQERPWTLQPGATIKRTSLHDMYGGGRQSGISPSAQTLNILIFTDPASGERHGYRDKWDEDGTFHYTGEGQRGDQQMTNGNAAILSHRATRRALRVFRGAGGMVEYLGEFVVDGDRPYDIDEAPETGGGVMRKVIVFNLQPVERVGSLQTQKNAAKVVPLEARSAERTLVQPPIEPMEAVRRESELVHAYAGWLRAGGVKVERLACSVAGGAAGRDMLSDIYIPQRRQLIEAKGVVTREGVRMAIGQLLDYRRFAPPDARLAVLLPRHPGPDLEALLTSVEIACIWRKSENEFEDNVEGEFLVSPKPHS